MKFFEQYGVTVCDHGGMLISRPEYLCRPPEVAERIGRRCDIYLAFSQYNLFGK